MDLQTASYILCGITVFFMTVLFVYCIVLRVNWSALFNKHVRSQYKRELQEKALLDKQRSGVGELAPIDVDFEPSGSKLIAISITPSKIHDMIVDFKKQNCVVMVYAFCCAANISLTAL